MIWWRAALIASAALAGAAAAPGLACASLQGNTVIVNNIIIYPRDTASPISSGFSFRPFAVCTPALCYPVTYPLPTVHNTPGSGTGVIAGGGEIEYTIGASTITIEAINGPVDWPGGDMLEFLDTSANPHIDDVTLASTTAPQVTGGDVHWTDTSVTFEFGGQTWADGETAVFDVDFSGPQTALPEPATWAMLLVGLFGVGATLRHRARIAGRAA